MLNSSYLKYFHDAVQAGSIVKAAKQNFVTPSAVSQGIRQLELNFDIDLLRHRKNNFHLTEAGQVLFDRTKDVLRAFDQLHTEVNFTKEEYRGQINFGTQQSIAQTCLPNALALMQKKYPKIVPRFKLGTTNIVRQWLEEGTITFALTLDHGVKSGFVKEIIREGYFVFIGKNNPDPSKVGLIVTGETPETLELKRLYEDKFNVEMPLKIVVDSWGVTKNLAESGLGVGFIPDYFYPDGVPKRFQIKSFLPKIPYKICVVYHKNRPLCKNSRAFLECMQDGCATKN